MDGFCDPKKVGRERRKEGWREGGRERSREGREERGETPRS